MLCCSQELGRMIQASGIPFLQKTRGGTPPNALSQSTVFLSCSVLHEQVAGDEIDVVCPTGRCFEVSCLLDALQLAAHIAHRTEQFRKVREPLKQLPSRTCRSFAHFPVAGDESQLRV